MIAATANLPTTIHASAPTAGAHPVMALPFVVLLLAIAVMPFLHAHWWERHHPKVSVTLGAVCALYYLCWLGDYERMIHVAREYLSFIALVGALFVIAGGIHVRARGEATPLANCLFLLTGAMLANIAGTTGASMLLIRPYLWVNKARLAPFHVVFFIFIVSNMGGCLTPVGDPPLFLGYLKGVPFWWVLTHCWRPWLAAILGMIAVFYGFDRRSFRRMPVADREEAARGESWGLEGAPNLIFLVIVLGAIFIEGPPLLREGIMIATAAGSFLTTLPAVHRANRFNFEPIKEVAWLFAGIFLTMVPVLDYLAAIAPSLGVRSEAQFFWLTGGLSGVLDNAPTYLALLATALGNRGLSIDDPAHVANFVANDGHLLVAISLGAVFFGAMTYIGNAPNFMVKAIAEQVGVKMPGFFGYGLRYSLPILVPFFAVLAMLLFSRWRVF